MRPPRSASLALVLALGAAPAARGQQALVGMYPAGVGLDSGQQALVPIVVDLRPGSYSMGSYQLTLSWNPAVLRYIRTGVGGFGVPVVNENNAATGSLVLAGAQIASTTGIVTLANVTFEMLVSSGSSPVTVVSPEFTSTVSFGAIPVQATPGTVCTSGGKFGDINNDGSILSNDALLIVTAAVGLPIAPYTLGNGDVDADGDADTRDALIILSSAVGLPTGGFRVGQPSGGACGGSPATTMSISPVGVQLAVGDTLPMSVQLLDASGNPTDAKGLVWSSTAPSVVSVDSAGVVTALSNGSATITASAIGVTPKSSGMQVQDRHKWWVDAEFAGTSTIHLGSFDYPFGEIQTAVDAAGPGDTVAVNFFGPAGYGPVTITKPIFIIGALDSFNGLPRIRNSTGPAITSNASGTVLLRNLKLEESNAGLDARGDSLIVDSVTTHALRGPAFAVRGMQYAALSRISAASAVLAGVLADSTGAVFITGADLRAIANRNDSAAAIAVLHGGSAQVTNVNVVGVENGSVAVFANLASAVLNGFAAQAAGGVQVDSVRNMTVANGQIVEGGDRPLNIHADSATIDSVVVTGANQGVQFTPMNRDSLTPPGSIVTITRSAVLNVSGGSGLLVDRFATAVINGTHIANVQSGTGIDVRRSSAVQIDSAAVSGIAGGIGVQVQVNPGTPSALGMRGGKIRGHEGGLSVNYVRSVALTGVEIDSSAIAPQFCSPCTPKFALQVWSPDSVQLDSVNIHDNSGAGAYVDSARIVVGAGGVLQRNQGFIGLSGGDCQFGCEQQPSPLKRSTQSAQFTLSNFPGIVLNRTQDTRLSGWTVHDNPGGGLFFTSWDVLSGPTAQITNSSFQGLTTGTLLSALGNSSVPSGRLIVQGGTFRRANQAVVAQNLDRFDLTASHIDSVGVYSYPGVQVAQVHNVLLSDDTLVNGMGRGFQVVASDTVNALRNVITDGHPIDVNSQEAALELNTVATGLIYGNRLERNVVRGIIVRNGSGQMTVDSNVVADDSGFAALQLHQAATVTRNMFARNANGIYLDVGGEPSQIHQNNFEANVFSAIRNESNDISFASGNWWNDARGPQCSGAVTGCDPSSTGDVAYGLNFSIDYSGFLPGPAAGAPLSVPVLRAARRGATR